MPSNRNGSSNLPALRPGAIELLRKIDESLQVQLGTERKSELLLEFLQYGDFKTATEMEKRVLLLEPEVLEICKQIKQNEAQMDLLTKGNQRMREYLDSKSPKRVLAAYDRLQRRADKAPLVNINIGTGKTHEEILEEIAKKNGG